MKKFKFILFIFLLTIILISCAPHKILYEEGSCEGVGQGHHGPIRVQVRTDPYRIKEIHIIEEYEMPELCKVVYEEIPKRVIKENSANVDVVAGATFTSKGLIEAIKDGLNKAKLKNNE